MPSPSARPSPSWEDDLDDENEYQDEVDARQAVDVDVDGDGPVDCEDPDCGHRDHYMWEEDEYAELLAGCGGDDRRRAAVVYPLVRGSARHRVSDRGDVGRSVPSAVELVWVGRSPADVDHPHVHVREHDEREFQANYEDPDRTQYRRHVSQCAATAAAGHYRHAADRAEQ